MAAGYAVAQEKPEQQSYAAGVALGRDIQTMLAGVNWGINPDKIVLLAGVIDTFSGHYQLSDAQLTRALAESEKAVNDARNRAAKVQTSKERPSSPSSKKKGTQKSPSGFWYRIDYTGDETIKENARVDIVVKEKFNRWQRDSGYGSQWEGDVTAALRLSAVVPRGNRPSEKPWLADDGGAAGVGVRWKRAMRRRSAERDHGV